MKTAVPAAAVVVAAEIVAPSVGDCWRSGTPLLSVAAERMVLAARLPGAHRLLQMVRFLFCEHSSRQGTGWSFIVRTAGSVFFPQILMPQSGVQPPRP